MRRITITLSLIFLALLVLDVIPGLRGGAGWRWPYQSPEHWMAVVVLVLVVAVYLIGLVVLRQRDGAILLNLAWIVLGGTVMGFAVAGIQSGDAAFTLFTRTVSPVQTGASTVAVREMAQNGIRTTIDDWPRVMSDAREANIIHFTTSPPGQPLIHALVARLTGHMPGAAALSLQLRGFQCADPAIMAYSRGELVSVALIGMLMPLWAALAAIAIYLAAANLSGDNRTGLRVASWWPLVPAVLMFTPTWNTLYPALAAGSFALLLAGMKKLTPSPDPFPEIREGEPVIFQQQELSSPVDEEMTRRKWLQRMMEGVIPIIAAGALMSVASFLNFAVMPIILLFAIYTLISLWITSSQPRQAIVTGLGFGVGLLSLWVGFWLMTGLTPLDLASVTADQHSDLVAGRDYLAWLLLHPYDVLMFTGWPLAGLWVAQLLNPSPTPPQSIGEGLYPIVHRKQGKAENRDQKDSLIMSSTGILAMSLLITLLLVDVAGVVQGENARIMSYYAPFVLLAGTSLLHRSPRWDLPLLAVQGLTVIVMASVLPVIPLDLNPPPAGPNFDIARLDSEAISPADATFTSANYAGSFTLSGYRYIADIGQQIINLETIWEGGEQVERPYQFVVIAQAENDIDGQITTAAQRWYAQDRFYPPTCWQSDDTIHDLTMIDLPPVSEPVVWTLELRAVDPRTSDVMQVTLPDGSTSDHVLLGPVKYP